MYKLFHVYALVLLVLRLFRFSDPAASGQGSTGNGGNTSDDPPSWLDGLRNLISRHNNDSGRVAELLYQENYTHRQRIRDLEGKQTPDGATVLTGDEAARWQAVKDVDVPALTTERDTLKQHVATAERERIGNAAAKLYDWEATVLLQLPNLPEIKLLEQNGTSTAVVAVDGKDILLPDYIDQHYAAFKPALQPGTQSNGTRYVSQSAGTQRPAADPVKRHIDSRYKVPGKQ